MRKLFVILCVAIISGCGSVSNPEAAIDTLQDRPGITPLQLKNIARTLRCYPNLTQLSIAFINDRNSIFYGAIRKNDTLKTIRNDTAAFEIGSLSKVFTSALLADLAYRERLYINQSIQDFLDFPLNGSARITFKELANHTSGLPRIPPGFVWESLGHMDNPYKNYGEEKLRQYMRKEMEPEHEPGTFFQYSNIGVGMLGYVLTQVEEQPYESLLQQNLVQPLGMRHTTTKRSLVKGQLVTGLTKRGQPAANWDLGALPGAGAILSTAEDLVTFGQTYFNPAAHPMQLQ